MCLNLLFLLFNEKNLHLTHFIVMGKFGELFMGGTYQVQVNSVMSYKKVVLMFYEPKHVKDYLNLMLVI